MTDTDTMDAKEFRQFVQNLIDDTSLTTDEKTDQITAQASSLIAKAFFVGIDAGSANV